MFFVGTAQPRWQPSFSPTYYGTMLRLEERLQAAERLSTMGRSAKTGLPLVLDHADLKSSKDLLPAEKVIGHVTDAFVDRAGNLLVAGEIYEHRPESKAIRDSIAMGRHWGLSFWTDLTKVEPGADVGGTDKVRGLRLSHLGVTVEPAWGKQADGSPMPNGTWIHHYGRTRADIDRVLRETYATEAGMFIPRATRDYLGLVSEVTPTYDTPPPAASTPPSHISAPSADAVRAGNFIASLASPSPSRTTTIPFTLPAAPPLPLQHRSMADSTAAPVVPAVVPVAVAPETPQSPPPPQQQAPSPASPTPSQTPPPAPASGTGSAAVTSSAAPDEIVAGIMRSYKQLETVKNPGERFRMIEKLLREVETVQRDPRVSIVNLVRGGVIDVVRKLDEELLRTRTMEENAFRTYAQDGLITPDVVDRLRMFAESTEEVARPVVDFMRASVTDKFNLQNVYERTRAELVQMTQESESRKRKLDEMEVLQKEHAALKEQVAKLQQAQAAATASTPAPAAQTASERLDKAVPIAEAVAASAAPPSLTSQHAVVTDALIRHQGVYADKERFMAELQAFTQRSKEMARPTFNPIAAGFKQGFDFVPPTHPLREKSV